MDVCVYRTGDLGGVLIFPSTPDDLDLRLCLSARLFVFRGKSLFEKVVTCDTRRWSPATDDESLFPRNIQTCARKNGKLCDESSLLA